MEKGHRFNREIWGVVAFVLMLFSVLSLISYSPIDGSLNGPSGALDAQNWGGLVGAYLADFLLQGLGLSAYFIPIFLLMVSYHLFQRESTGYRFIKTLGYGAFLWSIAILLSLLLESDLARESGGVVGGFSKAVLISLFGQGGTYIIVLFLLLLATMLIAETSLVNSFRILSAVALGSTHRAKTWLSEKKRRWRERRESRHANTKKERDYKTPPIVVQQDPAGEAARTAKKRSAPRQEQFSLPAISDGYQLPSLGFLDVPSEGQVKFDRETLEANSLILQRKLADFGIEGEVVAVRPGPVITMYEFRPAPGVLVRRIVTLADDLSMALSAVSVRILAPIPGESVVGIEVPNARREKVFLQQVLESESYRKSDSKLTLALGRDISGTPFVTDLGRMPHLLVAGATGTGKSVSINCMILSILYKATPQDVRFIMIDPKMLELTPYEGLPHLLTPVVTDPKKASAALFWAMEEMDRRYHLMRDKGAKNIDHYNRILAKEPPPAPLREEDGGEPAPDKGAGMGGNLNGGEDLRHERLPRIVILIDELADLMMSVGRDIEEYITRLAQKARAAGIHMVLATQRPSVDVITGLIKANFPARISFQVTSRVDSRTILDTMGAERLLGNGDMLFLPPGTARVVRIHGPYVSDREMRKVTEFIKQQGEPHYHPEIFDAKKDTESLDLDEEYDEMYDHAVAMVSETQQASISMLQRRLRVGYNRAARMIEQMERDGVVGPADGAKPREVYAKKIEE